MSRKFDVTAGATPGVMALLCVLLGSCDYDGTLERGLCAKTNSYLSDAEFLTVTLTRGETDAWEGRYANPSAFVAANPACCDVSRMPRKGDWIRGMYDKGEQIEYGLRRLGWSEYVVLVQVAYPFPRTRQTTHAAHWLGACGDLLADEHYRS